MKPTLAEAAQTVLQLVNETWGYPTPTDELVILHQYTAESPRAWAFSYNTRSCVETGDFGKGLMGNGPVIVIKATGHAELMSSGYDPASALEEIEKRLQE